MTIYRKPSMYGAPFAASLAALLGACAASSTQYPSLAIRDIERAQGQYETATGASADTLSPPRIPTEYTGNLADHLAALKAQADTAHLKFQAKSGTARAVALSAAGSTPDSNAWGSAQIALSDLGAKRSETAIVLADLETLYVAKRIQNEDVEAIDETRSAVEAIIAEQDAVLSELRRIAQ
jgi:hypothetical protein